MKTYLSAGLVLILLCTGLYINVDQEKEAIVHSSSDSIGIDISHHQGDIDWQKVNLYKGKPISFIYLKATEGATYQDPRYQEYFSEAMTSNIPLGSYHYFRTSSSVTGQFLNFISNVDRDNQDLVPMVDLEECRQWSSNQFRDSLDKFLHLMEDYYGKKPILYTVNSFYNQYLQHNYKDYMFCIGRYGKNQPNLLDGNDWTIWQYTEKGDVEGIEKLVDIDLLNIKKQVSNLKLK
jgi:lysozyme